MKKRIKRYLMVLLGLLLVSIAFNIFLLPNEFAAIGISGLALLFHELYSMDISLFVLISNLILIMLSYLVLDDTTTKRTVIGALLSPLLLKITYPLSYLIDLSSVDMLIQAFVGGVLSGMGYGMIFKQGYTSGGTDIVNQLMCVSYKIPLSKCIILCDGLIVLLGGLVFGLEKMIYSIIILLLISIYSNKTLIGIGMNKNFYIHTTKPRRIKNYLINVTKNDVTLISAKGGYTKKNIKILMSVINTYEYYKIKQGILELDPNAFIIVSESHELINGNMSLREF